MENDDLTIAQLAAASPDLSILVAALEATGLTSAVDDAEADFTVLAPTNAAFAGLATSLGFTGDTGDDDAVVTAILDALEPLSGDEGALAVLEDVLLYHVVPGARSEAAIFRADSLPTLSGDAAILPAAGRLVDAEPDLLDAEIVTPNVTASNGIVQLVDSVLLPIDLPGNEADSIGEIAAANPDFEVLTLALEATGLDAALADDNAEFTVFAPTDAAFADFAAGFGFEGDAEDPQAVFDAIAGALPSLAPEGTDPIAILTEILLFHVATGAFSEATLEAGGTLNTARGAGIVVSETAGILDEDPDRANPQFVDGATDIAASNGIVQAIDAVILPVNLDDPAPEDSIADIVLASGEGFDDDPADFDLLRQALTDTNLVAALDDPEAGFTVFAPNDAAFAALAGDLGAEGETEAELYDGLVAAITDLVGDGGDPIAFLSSVLLYHVIDGVETRAELSTGPVLESLIGPAPSTNGLGLADADPGFANPAFIDAATDIVAANGIVHAIDRVLLPTNLPDATDLVGTAGDDELEVGESTLVVTAGEGEDTVTFASDLDDVGIGFATGGFRFGVDGRVVEVFDAETIAFADETLTVSDDDLAAQVFRLYGVGLGRQGDVRGVSFWTDAAEENGLGFVADAILMSDEFAAQFGGVPGQDEIVEEFYANFLGREPDVDGLEFWQQAVESPAFDESDLLVAFSESAEFEALTAPQTDDGVLLLA